MSVVTPEDVTEFSSLVALAETGEMQSAVDTFGPYKVNPYYFDNPRMANLVGYFMNTVAPLAQRRHEDGDRPFSLNDIMATSSQSKLYEELTKTIELADRAGFLYKVSENEVSTLSAEYKVTRSGIELDPVEVFVTRYTKPERRGIATAFISGAAGALAVLTQMDIDYTLTPVYFTGTAIFSMYVGGRIGNKTEKLLSGREAFLNDQIRLREE